MYCGVCIGIFPDDTTWHCAIHHNLLRILHGNAICPLFEVNGYRAITVNEQIFLFRDDPKSMTPKMSGDNLRMNEKWQNACFASAAYVAGFVMTVGELHVLQKIIRIVYGYHRWFPSEPAVDHQLLWRQVLNIDHIHQCVLLHRIALLYTVTATYNAQSCT